MEVNETRFRLILDRRFAAISDTLVTKAREYATDADRLHNFHAAAALLRCTPEQACWAFLAKHLVSIGDMVASGHVQPREKWDEKLGDAINYLLLLEAITWEGEE